MRRSLLLLAALGCGKSSGTPPELPLRDGYVQIYRSDIPASRATHDLGSEGQAYVISDVTASLDEFVLAGLEGRFRQSTTVHTDPFDLDDPGSVGNVDTFSGAVRLYRGNGFDKSFQQMQLMTPERIQAKAMGYAEAGGRGAMLVPESDGSSGTQWVLAQLEPRTGAWSTVTGGRFNPAYDKWMVTPAGLLATAHDQGTGTTKQFQFFVYDVGQIGLKEGFSDSVKTPSGGTCGAGYYRYDGHGLFQGVCSDGTESCLVEHDTKNTDPTTGQYTSRIIGCFTTAQLDPRIGSAAFSNSREKDLIPYDNALWNAFEADGHVFLAGFDFGGSGRALAPIDLGPGKLWNANWYGLHPRFPDSLAISTAADPSRPARVVRFAAAAGDRGEVAFPATPCAGDDAKCAGSTLVAFAPTGDGRLLLVYDVRTADHQYIVIGYVAAPAVPGPPPPKPATALEQHCLAEQWCYPTAEPAYDACIDWWVKADPASYAAFLAAPLTCDGLKAADGYFAWELGWASGGAVSEMCRGDAAIRRPPASDGEGPGLVYLDCRAQNGGTCALDSGGHPACLGAGADCSGSSHCDAQGRAVDCVHGVVEDCPALGGVCRMTASNPSLPDPPRAVCHLVADQDACTFEPDGAVCDTAPDGAITSTGFTCFLGVASRRFDCTRLAMDCSPLGGGSGAHVITHPEWWDWNPRQFPAGRSPSTYACANYGTTYCDPVDAAPGCAGDNLIFCTMGNRRSLDCTSIGKHCRTGSLGARCE